MEKGSMRCDCNVSVKPAGSPVLGERCEIKNLNSKRFARQAVTYEAQRQIKLVEAGETFEKQTLHYDVDRNITLPLRDKEGVADYRYFPDPDLAPIHITAEQLNSIKSEMPKMPWEIKKDLNNLGIIPDHINQLTASPNIVEFLYALHAEIKDSKMSSNFIVNQLLPYLQNSATSINDSAITITRATAYLRLIQEGKVSASIANQRLWPELCNNPDQTPEDLAEKLGIIVNSDDSFLDELITQAMSENPNQVEQFRKGKKNLLGFFIGGVMRKSNGSADPKILQKKLLEALSK